MFEMETKENALICYLNDIFDAQPIKTRRDIPG